VILLDTDHVSALQFEQDARCLKLKAELRDSASSDEVVVPIVSVEENVRGWLAQIRSEKNPLNQVFFYEQFSNLLDFFRNWRVEPFDDRAAHEFLRLRRERVRIGTQDLKIASIALTRGALLLSANLRDFSRVPGLRVENWLE
jgi:tRNA(fMet)-specific endonuclease VapC